VIRPFKSNAKFENRYFCCFQKVSVKMILSLALTIGFTVGANSAEVEDRSVASTPDFVGSQDLIRFKVEKYKLENGLTVLLHEDHSVPLISYQTWFRVGSKNEEKGLTGIAHLFEHMMFKGAKRYSGEKFDAVLQANGANNNAFTTHDYTGYYENLPSSKLELVMDIESDRMQNLVIDEKNLDSERDVVKEERRFRVENSPTGILMEKLYAVLFKVSPYRWPVIGYMPDLGNVTVENATRFFKTYYSPSNAVLVIAGDFDSSSTKKMISKYYSAIPAQEIPRVSFASEPPQAQMRTAIVYRDIQSPYVTFNYITPKAGEDEGFALDLLASILGGGPSSRLYRRLVHKDQKVQSVSVSNSSMQLDAIFSVMAELRPNEDPTLVETAIRQEMAVAQRQLVTPSELKSAKNRVIKSYVSGLKTIHGKAGALAGAEIIHGDYEKLFTELDKYIKVSALDIKQAAAKHLGIRQASVINLLPKSYETKKNMAKEAKVSEAKESSEPKSGGGQ
jgi:zinc protease